MADGPREKVAAHAKSYTGQFLKRMLNGAVPTVANGAAAKATAGSPVRAETVAARV